MNRRSFLGLFTAASVAAGLGISSSEGIYSVRYLEAYDILEDKMIHRMDIGRGFDMPLPRAVNRGKVFTKATESQVRGVIERMSVGIPGMAIDALLDRMPLQGEMQGVSW